MYQLLEKRLAHESLCPVSVSNDRYPWENMDGIQLGAEDLTKSISRRLPDNFVQQDYSLEKETRTA
ncbi:hypothetical protein AGABI2DRAFT_191804 [Agaricus bisporus var. bisporus H97]|uniref:hypothetical protein n=1 Tax=Agaricus bisporus var. bisporus (strain H97 / ATCC MYA-4626 / FGSC 10389) TaxID=936046 RepID=UPI00029F6884|nr:hypothetical protein AGABI2DRAFT_191804 [Agaricus bisporus var. bisporus H97]EKV48170.1 hypothetical protein AGABI2DRAFT_191804 [Agaricus bisporus var. bisporus H97]